MERYLVTGSAGHLGEAVVRTLRERGDDVVGLDILDSPFTTVTGSITDRDVVRRALDGVTRVVHTATLHKPHVGSHSRQDFVDINVTGTLTVLEESAAAGVRNVVFTSSTSAFGRALTPAPGEPAAWITEDVRPVVRNIYGATKIAAEDLCELLSRDLRLPVVVLRTSRFFPEGDDRDDVRNAFDDTNLKVNEYAYRRVDLEDVVEAHLLAAHHTPEAWFDRFVISATTPFTRDDAAELATDAPAVFARVLPDLAARYEEWGWRMLPALDRVYSNERALTTLGWRPRYDIRAAAELARTTGAVRSPMAHAVGAKGYHSEPTGVYTT
ncbi:MULTISPECIES: NAD-dependent epimerase/dehydratase family protein [Prauserella salsuginis group]|uniref:NAD-dependent epimerase/dehydratase family protein n=1 Tax=Prauserella salsuginis TaxID=387889 RepID=A0ABW6G781_9PSEU|nr:MULTISPECIES: NAD(P)-dependent oxidoreductase [Prauserella salsuginis group]MCR3720748.1 Nucleoside-diphosphate-sugar epimerase [Prauserella flava]MCR3735171.1 Nucleoside-diphosphate-sugar epimerase [Prauserella salsuginis]